MASLGTSLGALLATWPMQPTLRVEGNIECPYTPDVHVRFTTADGRFGLVPDSVLGKAPEYLTPWTVTYGGATKTWEVERVADCDAPAANAADRDQ